MSDKEYTAVDYLDDLSNHFSYPEGWHWTRKSGVKKIEFHEVPRTQKLGFRIKFTLSGLFGESLRREMRFLRSEKKFFEHPLLWLYGKWVTVRVRLFKEKNIPDGHVKEPGIICFWEEDGEYICMMQPSVGALLAKFLKEDPDNEWAKKLTAELERVRSVFWEKD